MYECECESHDSRELTLHTFHCDHTCYHIIMPIMQVCGGAALELFEPSELELLICGNMVLDFHALKAGSKYADGFDESSKAVVWMWQILLDDFTDDERRLFLKFVSGR